MITTHLFFFFFSGPASMPSTVAVDGAYVTTIAVDGAYVPTIPVDGACETE